MRAAVRHVRYSKLGIAVQRFNGLAWGLAAVVAAVAGLLLAPITKRQEEQHDLGIDRVGDQAPGEGASQ